LSTCALPVVSTPAPTFGPTPGPATATPTRTVAPTSAPTATPIGQTAVIVPVAPAVASLPSTATSGNDYTFLILSLGVIIFVILYMVARARRRSRDLIL
jgi:hypothetical protein